MAIPLAFIVLPILLILLIFVVKSTIKNAQQKVDMKKHIRLRLLVLLAAIALLFLLSYLSWDKSGILGAIYFSAYFTGAWLLYLLIEAICLFAVKKNVLAKMNLAIFGFSAAIICLFFLKYWIIG